MSFLAGTVSSNLRSVVVARQFHRFAADMAETFLLICDVLMPVVVCFYLARIWLRWSRSDVKFGEPKWRYGLSAFGFAAGNLSLVIIGVVMFAGLMGNSFPTNSPMAAYTTFAILATSLLAMIAALVGKGQLGFPTAIYSGSCLILLTIHALAA